MWRKKNCTGSDPVPLGILVQLVHLYKICYVCLMKIKSTLAISEFRQNLPEAVLQVSESLQPIYITRFGKITAKLVPVSATEAEELANRQVNIMNFWGLWQDRDDIVDTLEYAKELREKAGRSGARGTEHLDSDQSSRE